MDGTFTVSSQSDRSPLSGGTLQCAVLFSVLFYLTAVTLPEKMRLEFSSILFPTSSFDTDAFNYLSVISKVFVKVLHVLNSSHF